MISWKWRILKARCYKALGTQGGNTAGGNVSSEPDDDWTAAASQPVKLYRVGPGDPFDMLAGLTSKATGECGNPWVNHPRHRETRMKIGQIYGCVWNCNPPTPTPTMSEPSPHVSKLRFLCSLYAPLCSLAALSCSLVAPCCAPLLPLAPFVLM